MGRSFQEGTLEQGQITGETTAWRCTAQLTPTGRCGQPLTLRPRCKPPRYRQSPDFQCHRLPLGAYDIKTKLRHCAGQTAHSHGSHPHLRSTEWGPQNDGSYAPLSSSHPGGGAEGPSTAQHSPAVISFCVSSEPRLLPSGIQGQNDVKSRDKNWRWHQLKVGSHPVHIHPRFGELAQC